MEFCLYSHYYICYIVATCKRKIAGVAQLVEQRFCKPRAGGSIPLASFNCFMFKVLCVMKHNT